MLQMMRACAIAFLVACLSCRSAAGPDTDLKLLRTNVPHAIALSARVAPDSAGVLIGWLDLTNNSLQTVQFDYGACAFAVQLRRAGENLVRWQSEPDGIQICILIIYQVNIGPGATASIAAGRLAGSHGVPAPPSGRYVLDVVLNDGGALRRVTAGMVDIP